MSKIIAVLEYQDDVFDEWEVLAYISDNPDYKGDTRVIDQYYDDSRAYPGNKLRIRYVEEGEE